MAICAQNYSTHPTNTFENIRAFLETHMHLKDNEYNLMDNYKYFKHPLSKFDFMEIVMDVEDYFHVTFRDDDLDRLSCLRDVIDLAQVKR